jgi:hypothetical protein
MLYSVLVNSSAILKTGSAMLVRRPLYYYRRHQHLYRKAHYRRCWKPRLRILTTNRAGLDWTHGRRSTECEFRNLQQTRSWCKVKGGCGLCRSKLGNQGCNYYRPYPYALQPVQHVVIVAGAKTENAYPWPHQGTLELLYLFFCLCRGE